MKNLIGKKVRGFKFESRKDCSYTPQMNIHISEVGKIVYYYTEVNIYRVEFEDNFWNYPAEEIEKHLVTEFKRGDKVLVRDEDNEVWEEAIFLTEIEGAKHPFVVVNKCFEKYFLEGKEFFHISWKQIKPIEEKTEVTLEEIAEKFGIEVENLKIKK